MYPHRDTSFPGCSDPGIPLARELSTRGGSKFAEAWLGQTFLIQFPRLRPASFSKIPLLPVLLPLTVSVLTLLRLFFSTKKICKENISRRIFRVSRRRGEGEGEREIERRGKKGERERDTTILIFFSPPLFNFSFLWTSNF